MAQPKFKVGELVTVCYNDSELYEIFDYWHAGDIDEYFYMVESLEDGMVLEVHEGEIQSPYEKYASMWSDLTPDEMREVADWNASFKAPVVEEPIAMDDRDIVIIGYDVDTLLDQYNIYTALLDMFPGDKHYTDMLGRITKILKVKSEVN